jgi:mono/diheme cytochrome c family protein
MKTLKAIALLTVMMLGIVLISATTRVSSQDQFDAAATYKSKCVACHGAAAEKKFDATLPETDMVTAILKGKKVEKPPHMPAYEEKGINEEQAKALIAHMKSVKK